MTTDRIPNNQHGIALLESTLAGYRNTVKILLQENCTLQNEVTSLSDSLTHCQTVNTEMVQTIRDLREKAERLGL